MRSTFDPLVKLWRMSAVRQAFVSALTFAIVTGLTAVGAFFALTSLLSDRVDATLLARADALRASGAVTATIQRSRPLEDDLEGRDLYAFVSDGGVLTGVSLLRGVPSGYSTTEFVVDDDETARYRVLAQEVSGGTLIIATPLEDQEASIALIASFLLWGGLGAAALTLAVGVAIGLTTQRRIRAIETGLGAVAGGDLGARLPVSDRNDDIDRVAGATNLAIGRLETSVAALRDLSANIAHDLKTPMARLHQRLSGLAESAGNDAMGHEIENAAAESVRIGEIFDAVLRISQIEAGARREKFKPVDLADVAARVDDIFRAVAEDEKRAFDVRVDGGPAMVHGDRDLLVQAVSNCIANAFRHTPPGTAVELHIRDDAGRPVLDVADRGPGIPSEQRERVLERFVQLDDSRASAGTGLGLTLVRAVADLHGAELSLTGNHPGLRVTLAFPGQAS